MQKNEIVASSSKSGTQKSVEIDPKPSEDENRKKSNPQMENDDQEIEEVALIEGTDKTVRIRGNLDPQIRLHLIQVLRHNADLFAYSAADMPGIDPGIITHKLNIHEGVKPVKQKKRNFGPEKDKIIEKEVQKLLDAGFIEECLYPECLANVVLVKKPQPEKWRMCIDLLV